MTDISQTQAGFKAKNRRNPLWIPRLFNTKSGYACRNRRYFRLFQIPLRDIWKKLNARLSRHTLSTELIFIRFALPQNDFDTCIRRRNVVIWLKRNLSFHLQCFLQRLCTCFCTFYCQSNTQNVPGQQRFVFCTKSWFFLPPEHVSMAFSQYMRS